MENARVDFEAVKQIPIVKIAERFGIKLTGSGKWRYGQCPLPSHDPDKLKTKWGINTAKNYWSCWSKSCQERREGREWGDGITLVQFLEGCGAREAAEKLTGWFLETQKPPQAEVSAKSAAPNNSTTESGKGYMAEVDAWFDKLAIRGIKESEAEFLTRIRKAVKTRLLESFRAGVAKNQKAA